jgi:lysophospholipase L1-like esterase
MPQKAYSYLALGDSYTVGEGLETNLSFPYLLVQKLISEGIDLQKIKVIAQTGWTSGELIQNITQTELKAKFDFATLLIGVNNQYQGLDISIFESELKYLIETSQTLLQTPCNLWVLSIPDYGQTPYVRKKNLDFMKIRAEINDYNQKAREICEQMEVNFVDITHLTSNCFINNDNIDSFLTSDELHFSSLIYEKWAEKLASAICRGGITSS